MPRRARVLSAAERQGRPVADTLLLDYAQRSAQRFAAAGLKGGQYELARAGEGRLQTDDVLALDEGTLLEVVAAPEPLIEARAADLAALARLAWHLGDRHVPVQVLPNRIRLRRDAALEQLLAALGARLAFIDAPFEPEGGAYATAPAHDHGHHHGHEHNHGHHHAHDRHGHAHDRAHCHGHDHDHGHEHHHDHDH